MADIYDLNECSKSRLIYLATELAEEHEDISLKWVRYMKKKALIHYIEDHSE
jgi:hypothetical protein